MRFHPKLILDLSLFVAGKKLRRQNKFSLVLMLEPLYACNLACDGCGRIREYRPHIHKKLSLEECFQAVDEAQTPVVSIAGGEPMIYPEIAPLVEGLIRRKKHIYLCTNGLYLEKILPRLKPSPYLNINVSLDALKDNHNRSRNNPDVFDAAIAAIRTAKQRGFRVVINTTIYTETDMDEIDQLFALLTGLGTDGIILSPGFGYQEIAGQMTLSRQDTHRKFALLDTLRKKYHLLASPVYQQFLQGRRNFLCAPWSSPTRNVLGWKGPCYLITDTHHKSYQDLLKNTPWEKYGSGRDPRCAHCMMHVGYEAAASEEACKKIPDLLKILWWNFTSRG